MQLSPTILVLGCLSLIYEVIAVPMNETQTISTVVFPAVTALNGTLLGKREDEANTFNVAEVWTDANRGGSDGMLVLDSLPTCCLNFVSPFTRSISSVQVYPGFICGFFANLNCEVPGFNLSGNYIPDLNGGIFQDSLLSISCDAV